jgi:hypothetical protein
MTTKLSLHAAGNTVAPALAELISMGYIVSRIDIIRGPVLYQAENSDMVVKAEDPLQLLGLVVLVERRGSAASQPTSAEVDALLRLDNVV